MVTEFHGLCDEMILLLGGRNMMVILVHDADWNYKVVVLAENLEMAEQKAFKKLKEIYSDIILSVNDLIAEYLDCDEVII